MSQTHHLPVSLDLPLAQGSIAHWSIRVATHLVVFVHGFGGGPASTWPDFPLLLAGKDGLPKFDFLFYKYDGIRRQANNSAADFLGFAEPFLEDPAQLINAHIPAGFSREPFKYERIVLVAHSLGAVVVRVALIEAHTRKKNASMKASWLSSVRLVLLAPAHHGAYGAEIAYAAFTDFGWTPGKLLGYVARYKLPLLKDLQPGSPTIEALKEATKALIDQYPEPPPYVRAHSVLWARDEYVVHNARFLADADHDYVDTDHQGICKPKSEKHRALIGTMNDSLQLSDANFASLTQQFFDPQAEAGERFLLRASESEAARTLESHLLRGPSDRALAVRDDVDHLLRYYSALELAALSGIVSLLPSDISSRADRILRMPSVRRYYENYYPLLLPRLLLRRLVGSPLTTGRSESDVSAFSGFVTLDLLRRTPEVQMFLWFLDDVSYDDYELSDVLTVTRDPRKFAQCMTREPAKRNARDMGVRGFIEFLQFSREYKAMLDSIADARLRSAFWHFHGYWYQLIGGQVLGVLTAGVEALRTHVGGDPKLAGHLRGGVTDERSKRVILARNEYTNNSMDAAIRDLQLLTSAIYRFPLEDEVLRHGVAVAR